MPLTMSRMSNITGKTKATIAWVIFPYKGTTFITKIALETFSIAAYCLV